MLLLCCAGESLPVTLTLESVSATSATIKWSAEYAPVSAYSPRLLIRRLVQFDDDSLGGGDDASVRVVELESTDSDGHYHLDELIDGRTYSAQMVVDQPYNPTANLSNVLYFTTPDGLTSLSPPRCRYIYKLITISSIHLRPVEYTFVARHHSRIGLLFYRSIM